VGNYVPELMRACHNSDSMSMEKDQGRVKNGDGEENLVHVSRNNAVITSSDHLVTWCYNPQRSIVVRACNH